MGGERERGILRVAIAVPRQLAHRGAHFCGDGFARVRRVVERHDDLGNPALHAGEAAGKVGRLVSGDDDDREGELFGGNHW